MDRVDAVVSMVPLVQTHQTLMLIDDNAISPSLLLRMSPDIFLQVEPSPDQTHPVSTYSVLKGPSYIDIEGV